MPVFRLLLAYDGTEFHGWQLQPRLRTVEGEVRRAAAEVLGHELGEVHVAGRTDAGVHARGQVASFASDTALPVAALKPMFNRALPADVRVRDAGEAPAGFHARHSARARHYSYRLLREDDVIWSRTAWFPGRPVEAEALERATRVLEGTHDCTSLRSAGSAPSRPVCRVFRAAWSDWEGGLKLDVVADHFLYHMVRTLVGTALAAARSADPASAMRAVLATRSRGAAGVTAPPQGLCLERVAYDGEEAA